MIVQSCNIIHHQGVKKEKIGAIADENKQYHDMLLPNVEDNYHTVGIKLLSSFNWIRQLKHIKDLKWIMKIDDDIMVNFTRLDKYLTSENIDQQGDKFFACSYLKICVSLSPRIDISFASKVSKSVF